MAILYDLAHRYSLTIEPIIPTLTGPKNAYDVRIKEGEQVIFERQYTTYPGSSDGHWYIWRLIRAFQSASKVLDAKTEINFSSSGDEQFREGVVLRASTGWLDVAMHGHIQRGQHPQLYEIVRFVVEIKLLDEPQLKMAEQKLVPFVHTELSCLPNAVEAFGNELLAECRAALERRQELGMTSPADDYIDT